jgi:hypothetical protein
MIKKLIVVSYMTLLAIPALIVGGAIPAVVGSIVYALTPKPK